MELYEFVRDEYIVFKGPTIEIKYDFKKLILTITLPTHLRKEIQKYEGIINVDNNESILFYTEETSEPKIIQSRNSNFEIDTVEFAFEVTHSILDEMNILLASSNINDCFSLLCLKRELLD
jgi:hypothetical protein